MPSTRLAAIALAASLSPGCRVDRSEPVGGATTASAGREASERVLWRDDFDRFDRGSWNVTTSASGEACRSDGIRFNGEEQAYTSNVDCAAPDHNLCVSGGTAKLVVRRQDGAGCQGYPTRYTSVRLNTKGKRGFSPTDEHPAIRIEARVRMPAQTPGVWPAFWTLGRDLKQGPILGDDANDWPDAGEIDIAEVGWAWDQAQVTLATLHDSPGTWSSYDGENHRGTRAGRHPIGRHEWHTYAVEWRKDSIRWLFDGVPFGRTVDLGALPDHDFEHEHFLLLNFAIGGAGGGALTSPDALFPSNGASYTPEQVLEVDYVEVVALDPSTERSATP